MQREIDAHRAVRKMNAAVVGAIDRAGIEERIYVAMVGTAINLNKGSAVAGAEKNPGNFGRYRGPSFIIS